MSYTERRSTRSVIPSVCRFFSFERIDEAAEYTMRITASAPTRIDLAGGTLDIWPLYLFHEDAQTINAAISLRAHAEIVPRTDGRVVLESIDTSSTVDVSSCQQLANGNGLPLLGKLAYFFKAANLTLRTRAESPAGAGIAGSSALNVAVLMLDGKELKEPATAGQYKNAMYLPIPFIDSSNLAEAAKQTEGKPGYYSYTSQLSIEDAEKLFK